MPVVRGCIDPRGNLSVDERSLTSAPRTTSRADVMGLSTLSVVGPHGIHRVRYGGIISVGDSEFAGTGICIGDATLKFLGGPNPPPLQLPLFSPPSPSPSPLPLCL